jgi:UDP-N-acetylglucosamine--N-acetylmuramyl-(pentapeptide) pyrophosphoryl-undecaprenol N-acetylglucosamine transferase
MGGSQGASALNDLVLKALPELLKAAPDLQFIHLTGVDDVEKTRENYLRHGVKAVVRPFLTEMELALGAATVAVTRAGASSLAELAAMRLPSVLIPYPIAADNHQFHNARAFVETGAALMLEQREASGEQLASLVTRLLLAQDAHAKMAKALEQWHSPHAAALIAERMLATVEAMNPGRRKRAAASASSPLRILHSTLGNGPSEHSAGKQPA